MISRLYNFEPNQTIASSQMDAELDQLVSEVNLKVALAGGTISGGLTVTGSFGGTRELCTLVMTGVVFAFGSADNYITLGGVATANEQACPVGRAGSFTGFSVFVNCLSYTSNCAFTPTIRKNGSNIVTGAGITVGGTGIQVQQNTYTRGTHVFSANDRLSFFYDNTTAGTASGILIVLGEVQYDS